MNKSCVNCGFAAIGDENGKRYFKYCNYASITNQTRTSYLKYKGIDIKDYHDLDYCPCYIPRKKRGNNSFIYQNNNFLGGAKR